MTLFSGLRGNDPRVLPEVLPLQLLLSSIEYISVETLHWQPAAGAHVSKQVQ